MKINVQNRLINIMKVLFLLSVLCMGALAETGTVYAATSGDFEYTVLDDGTVEITKYSGSAAEVDIPEKIDGKTVTSIGYKAFCDCVTITECSIPSGVMNIGFSAFKGCSGLTKINIPDSVIDIGSSAFSGCRRLKEVRISNGVASIGKNAFYECSGNLVLFVEKDSYAESYAVDSELNYEYYTPIVSISKGTICLEYTTCEYDGKKKTPSVVVTLGNETLVEGKDYKVTYLNNMGTGTASVVVEGIGDRFSGTKNLNFTIVPKDYQSILNQIKRYKLSPEQYNYGNDIFKKSIDAINIRDGDYTLKAGTDYTIKYKSNRNVGTAKITIKCKGNYKGEVTVKFKIVPRYPERIVRDKRVKNKIIIKWRRVPEAGGYKVYRSTKQKGGYKLLKTIKSNKTLSYTDKTAKKGTQYYYKIASYKKVSGKVYETKSPALCAKR